MGFSFRLARRAAAFAAACCFVLSIAPTASADPESEAKDLFARGRDLRASGDCAGAVPLFRKAWKIYPNGLGSARNVAECEEQLGHFASAHRAWLDIKRALLTMKEDPKYAGWDKDAEDAAKRLQPKVAVVFVDVIVKSPKGEGPATESSGVEILMNGENLGPNLVGTPLERDPGQYKVRVQAPYAEPVTQDVVLSAGDSKRLTLRIVQTPPEKPVGAPAMVDTGGGKRTAGWVLVGVGGAALIGGFVTLIVRGGALSDLESLCGAGVSDSVDCGKRNAAAGQDLVDKGKTMSTMSSILLPAGGVLAAAGIGLVIWGSNSKEPAASSAPAQGSLTVVPGPARVDAVWRF